MPRYMNRLRRWLRELFCTTEHYFYYIFLFLLFGIVAYFGYDSIPKKAVDNDKRYLVCEKGLYPFSEVGIFFWNKNNSEDLLYSNDFDKKAQKACTEYDNVPHYWESTKITPEIARAELMRRKLIKEPNHEPYTVSIEFKTEGSWKDAFEWWLVGSAMIYSILNIIKETLVYLAFGRKFSWVRLTKIYNYMKAIL